MDAKKKVPLGGERKKGKQEKTTNRKGTKKLDQQNTPNGCLTISGQGKKSRRKKSLKTKGKEQSATKKG